MIRSFWFGSTAAKTSTVGARARSASSLIACRSPPETTSGSLPSTCRGRVGGHERVVARDQAEANAEPGQPRATVAPASALTRVVEHEEPGKGHPFFVGGLDIGARLHPAAGDAEDPVALARERTEASEDPLPLRLDRHDLAVGAFGRGADLEDAVEGALRDHQPSVRGLDQDREAFPDEVVRHLVALGVGREVEGAERADCLVDRVRKAGLERAVQVDEPEHPVARGACGIVGGPDPYRPLRSTSRSCPRRARSWRRSSRSR